MTSNESYGSSIQLVSRVKSLHQGEGTSDTQITYHASEYLQGNQSTPPTYPAGRSHKPRKTYQPKATENAIRNNKPEEEIWLKISTVLANAKVPACNMTIQERRAMTSLGRAKDILSADNGTCTVMPYTTGYDAIMISLHNDNIQAEELELFTRRPKHQR